MHYFYDIRIKCLIIRTKAFLLIEEIQAKKFPFEAIPILLA